jgi:lipopolysaccharide biosynthesis protein
MRARLIAFYLPQFHPIPENDAWWGPGFTEWTNVARARPRYPGHYQPRIPADLGFYDLRLLETREAQAQLAERSGIEGFCYYHYWFAGRRILERPFNEVLATGAPQFPFCLCWANQSWAGVWHGAPERILIEQRYPGEEDHRAHFEALCGAFRDRRYIRVEDKPVFVVYQPRDIPGLEQFVSLWQRLARSAGLPGIHFVGSADDLSWRAEDHGFDARVPHLFPAVHNWFSWRHPRRKLTSALRRRLGRPTVYQYDAVVDQLLPPGLMDSATYPSVLPNWDNTPRSGALGVVLHGSTPARFGQQLKQALDLVAEQPPERRLVFVKSWNEWAEGNYLEPDLRYGHEYLDVIAKAVGAR